MSDADRLREAFDRGFAEAPAPRDEALEGFLAVGVGAENYAIRLREVAALRRDATVTGFAAGAPSALLGLAAFRGVVAPVYDLGALLGGAKSAAPRWLVLVHAPSLVALAFERFDGHVRADRGAVVAASAGATGGALVRGAVRLDGAPRGLLHVASVVDEIRRLSGPRTGG